ncbi:MAG TPA: hypothetical protein VGN18_04685 [Jatrophihabitans sp.]|uniref:hypothetical protein n=1 Tax=Jatrophihabitans sp. TaxID=1932789 RepID=UPI002E07105D|nr:hypothetical protein [Jatrophihabitans sp.]
MWQLYVLFFACAACLLYWFSSVAQRIENDTRGMLDESSRAPYGTKFWAILTFNDRE